MTVPQWIYLKDSLKRYAQMASIQQTLSSITYSISVYVGFCIVIFGLFGNLINLLVFTQLKYFRKNQSVLYLMSILIVECFQLIFATTTRIVTSIFNYDPTRTSIIWCKIRIYFIQIGGLAIVWIICHAAIDQYFSTNHRNRLRMISTYKLAQYLIIFTFILSAIYSMPAIIYNEIRSTLGCTTYNSSYNFFYSFIHLCIIIGILPMIVAASFSCLAYQNVRRIIRRQIPLIRRRLDRQLTAMVLARVALFIVVACPYFAYRVFRTNVSILRTNSPAYEIDQLVRASITTFYSLNNSVSLSISTLVIL